MIKRAVPAQIALAWNSLLSGRTEEGGKEWLRLMGSRSARVSYRAWSGDPSAGGGRF
jgi:hypothetical protein